MPPRRASNNKNPQQIFSNNERRQARGGGINDSCETEDTHKHLYTHAQRGKERANQTKKKETKSGGAEAAREGVWERKIDEGRAAHSTR